MQARFDPLFLNQFAYLFFTDIDRIAIGETYSKYEQREPGYGKAMLDAYLWAFNQKLHRKISTDFILNLHKQTVQHLPEATPGRFKTGSNNFVIGLPEIMIGAGKKAYAGNPNATVAGFRQFINNWMTNQTQPLHFVHFKSPDKNIYFTPVNGFGERGLWVQIIADGDLLMLEPYSEKHNEFLEKLLAHAGFRCHINSTPTDIINYFDYTDSIEKIITQRMNLLCAKYNESILAAKTDREKIAVIIQHAQLMSQLHGFKDGNTRTFAVLVNRLLDEENMPLSLLINPNRMDCFSIDELVDMVERGQQYYLQLCQGNMPEFADNHIYSKLDITPQTIPGAESEIVALFDLLNLINGRRNKAAATLETPRLSDGAKAYSPTLFGDSSIASPVGGNGQQAAPENRM